MNMERHEHGSPRTKAGLFSLKPRNSQVQGRKAFPEFFYSWISVGRNSSTPMRGCSLRRNRTMFPGLATNEAGLFS